MARSVISHMRSAYVHTQINMRSSARTPGGERPPTAGIGRNAVVIGPACACFRGQHAEAVLRYGGTAELAAHNCNARSTVGKSGRAYVCCGLSHGASTSNHAKQRYAGNRVHCSEVLFSCGNP